MIPFIGPILETGAKIVGGTVQAVGKGIGWTAQHLPEISEATGSLVSVYAGLKQYDYQQAQLRNAEKLSQLNAQIARERILADQKIAATQAAAQLRGNGGIGFLPQISGEQIGGVSLNWILVAVIAVILLMSRK